MANIVLTNEEKELKGKIQGLLSGNTTPQKCTQAIMVCSEAKAWGLLRALIERLDILSTINNIPDKAFEGFTGAPSIEIKSNIYTIGNRAFKDSGVQKIIFEEGIEEIGDNAFENSSIVSVELPESITKLGNGLFKNCEHLKMVYIPDSVTRLPVGMFEGCPDDIVVYAHSRKKLPPSKRLRVSDSEIEWYSTHLQSR